MGEKDARRVGQFLRRWAKATASAIGALVVAAIGAHVLLLPILVGAYVEAGLNPIEAQTMKAGAISAYWYVAEVLWLGIWGSAVYAAAMTFWVEKQ